jgi:hypothetical protein
LEKFLLGESQLVEIVIVIPKDGDQQEESLSKKLFF